MVEKTEDIKETELQTIAMMQMYEAGFLDGYWFSHNKNPKKKISLELQKGCIKYFRKRFEHAKRKLQKRI